MRIQVSVLCVGVALSGVAAAAEPPALPGQRVAPPPTIDGAIGADEWKGAATGAGGFDQMDGHAAPEPMQFWLAYDDQYIYFAARLSDRDPRALHAQQYQTNVNLSGDDNVQLQLDLNGSLVDYNNFGINPRGATQLELAGGRADKREWSGEFVARSRVTESGWETEARIPWQMLRLPRAGVRNLRFNVVRFVPRDQRSYAFTYTQSGRQAETPVWQAVTVPRQQIPRVLKLLPYVYAGDEAQDGAVVHTGVDMKTEWTDRVTLVGTIHPDFRNIENQILSLDFSRFERLANETRPFFREGGNFMNSALYASQRIRSVDTGLNAYGHLNDRTSFGVIDTVRFGQEHDLIANTSYDPNPNDSYRVTGTSLTRSGGLQNSAYLARYSRQQGPFGLFLRSMGSDDTTEGRGQYGTAGLFYNRREWNAGIGYDRVSPHFLPRLGFQPEVNYKGMNYNLGFNRVLPRGRIAEFGLFYFGTELDHVNGQAYRRHHEINGTLALRSRIQAGLNYFAETFEGQKDHLAQSSLRFPRDDAFRNVSVGYDQGTLALLRFTSVSSAATYRFGTRLQTSARYQQVRHGDERQNQLILTSSYDLTHNRSVSGRIVKSDSDRNGYVSLRQSGNRGLEYFLIAGDPNASRYSRSLIVKVVAPVDVLLNPKSRRDGRPGPG